MGKPDIECVLRAGALNGERPEWDAARARLFWVDVREPAFHCFDPASGQDERWELPAWIGCYALTERGAQIALRTGLFALDFTSGALSFLAPTPFDPRRFIFNEGTCDRQGRFWAGPMLVPLAPRHQAAGAPKGLPFWQHRDGAWQPGTGPVQTANCLTWSEDGSRMFHGDTEQRTIWVSDYDTSSGEPAHTSVFARVESAHGGPDGVALDRDGCLWCAVFSEGKLLRFDPEGKVERTVAMPVQYPTMPGFGGADTRTIYVTSANWPLDERERRSRPEEGGIFAFEAPAPGVPATRLAG